MPENEEKKQSVIDKLSKREKIMVIALVLVVIVFVAMYFFIAPAVTDVANHQTEIDELNVQKAQTQLTISLRESYQKQYAEEKQRFDEAIQKYEKPMTPEALDETVTGILIKAGFDPLSINMSSLTVEQVPQFHGEWLQDGVIPESGESDEPAAEEAPPAEEAASFVYNVQANAEGGAAEIYSLIRDLAGSDSISLESYALNSQGADALYTSDSEDNTGAADVPLTGKQDINMTFKLYVYVDGIIPNVNTP